MPVFIDEFLYRGRPEGGGEWHVVLGSATDAFGITRVTLSQPLTPAKAAEQGFDLKAILKWINSTALQEADDLRAALHVKISDLEAAGRSVEELQAALSAAGTRIAKLEQRVSDETSARADAAVQVATLQATVARLKAKAPA